MFIQRIVNMGCDLVFSLRTLGKGELEQLPDSTFIIKNSSLQKPSDIQNLDSPISQWFQVSLKTIANELLKEENEKTKNNLVNAIKKLKDTSSKKVTIDTIRESGIVGNCKYHTLQYKYPGKLPNLITSYDPDILLIDKLSIEGKLIKDTIVRQSDSGKEVFVVEDSDRGIEKLARFMKVRDLILNEFKGNEELQSLLPELAKIGKHFSSQQDLLLDYLTHKSEYIDLLVDKGLFGLLNEITKNLENENRVGYNNPVDREFNSKVSWKKDSNKGTITIKQFLNLVNKFNPELIQNLTSTDLENNVTISKVFQKFYDNNFEEFSGKLVEVRNNDLVIYRNGRTLETTDDITYPIIEKQVVEVRIYKGYHIFKRINDNSETYTYNQHGITPKTRGVSFNYSSLEKVYSDIDNDANNLTFVKGFDADIRFVSSYERTNNLYSKKFYAPETVIKMLDIALDRDTILDPEEATLLANETKKLSNFYDTFKKQLTDSQFRRLQEVIDNIEAAGVFIYLINERAGSVASQRNLKNSYVFDEIINEIDTAIKQNKYKSYFVESYKSGYMKVIPLKSTLGLSEKFQRPTPTIDLLYDVVEAFKNKFGVDATILNQDEINNSFSDIPANTRAFIRDSKIYINGNLATSEDVVHEYTHLILGALKSKNFNMYMQLLNTLLNPRYEKELRFHINKVSKLYSNLAKSDFLEEVFVSAFSNFLAGKDSSRMFRDIKKEVDKEMKSIFNLASEEDFNSLYKGNFKAVMQTFSRDIGLQSNGLEFKTGRVFREASNWISEQIEKKNIEEKGC